MEKHIKYVVAVYAVIVLFIGSCGNIPRDAEIKHESQTTGISFTGLGGGATSKISVPDFYFSHTQKDGNIWKSIPSENFSSILGGDESDDVIAGSAIQSIHEHIERQNKLFDRLSETFAHPIFSDLSNDGETHFLNAGNRVYQYIYLADRFETEFKLFGNPGDSDPMYYIHSRKEAGDVTRMTSYILIEDGGSATKNVRLRIRGVKNTRNDTMVVKITLITSVPEENNYSTSSIFAGVFNNASGKMLTYLSADGNKGGVLKEFAFYNFTKGAGLVSIRPGLKDVSGDTVYFDEFGNASFSYAYPLMTVNNYAESDLYHDASFDAVSNSHFSSTKLDASADINRADFILKASSLLDL